VVEDEFVLRYQPIVDLGTSTVTSVEALLRWDHPVHGLLAPARFISAVEDWGLITDVGSWVLRAAYLDAARWRAAGRAIPVAVNVSPAQLSDTRFTATVLRAASAAGEPPSSISLEVTETTEAADIGVVDAALRRVKELGIRVALDDFGTGFSTMVYLKHLPVDAVKVDRAFVSPLGGAWTPDHAIVANLLALGDALGIDVVAEGVETRAQFDALARLGCHRAQGFLWSHPVPAAQLADVIDRIERR
jgi:EAL domain-containing protein (putative c-di-GMP-specific phosphodiesterase class I)